jgi:hypothetical protein
VKPLDLIAVLIAAIALDLLSLQWFRSQQEARLPVPWAMQRPPVPHHQDRVEQGWAGCTGAEIGCPDGASARSPLQPGHTPR